MRPILLNSCARAATAAEARFRIDAPIVPSRGARVIALDDGAVTIVAKVAGQPWANTRFFRTAGPERLHALGPGAAGNGTGGNGTGGGGATGGGAGQGGLYALGPELDGVDVAVMVATSAAGAQEAEAIGTLCATRRIMTAGVALSSDPSGETVGILRPYARVLLVTSDDEDVSALLMALRA